MPLSCVPYMSKHGASHSVFDLLAIFAAEMRADQPDAERANVDSHLVARDQRHVPQVRGKAEDDVDLPRLDQLDLPPRRRGGAAAGHHRNRTGVTPQRFARCHAAVGQTERIRHQHQIAGPNAVQRKAAPAENRHRLAVHRCIQHRARQAGRAAAGLQHQRHALAVFG